MLINAISNSKLTSKRKVHLFTQTDRQRQTHGQTDIDLTHGQTDRDLETHGQTDTHTDRQTRRQTDTQTDRQTNTDRQT